MLLPTCHIWPLSWCPNCMSTYHRLKPNEHSVNAVVDALSKEKGLVRAFSVIVREGSLPALRPRPAPAVVTSQDNLHYDNIDNQLPTPRGTTGSNTPAPSRHASKDIPKEIFICFTSEQSQLNIMSIWSTFIFLSNSLSTNHPFTTCVVTPCWFLSILCSQ